MGTKFKREERYLVFKLSDVEEHFTPGERQQLARLAEVQREGRSEGGKPLLECVVVESDWPEYEPTWQAIEARVTGAQPTPSISPAANPSAIHELLDSLSAAESDALEQARLNGIGAERELALMAKLEVAEKEVEIERMRLAACGVAALGYFEGCAEEYISASLNDVLALRAKIAGMENQEPFDANSDVFRSAFEAALKAGNWPATRQGDGYRSPSTQIAWRIAFSTVNRLKLYLAPGAKGE